MNLTARMPTAESSFLGQSRLFPQSTRTEEKGDFSARLSESNQKELSRDDSTRKDAPIKAPLKESSSSRPNQTVDAASAEHKSVKNPGREVASSEMKSQESSPPEMADTAAKGPKGKREKESESPHNQNEVSLEELYAPLHGVNPGIPTKVHDEIMEAEVDPLTKRVAMQQFLHKMRQEIHVEPQQLIQAFSELTPLQLQKPPTESVEQVIENLGLPPQEKAKAQELFQDLFKATASTSLAEYLKGSERELSLEVMSEKDLSQKNLQASIDRLNKDFFVDGKQFRGHKDLEQANHKQAQQAGFAAYAKASTGKSEAQTGATQWGLEAETFQNGPSQSLGKNLTSDRIEAMPMAVAKEAPSSVLQQVHQVEPSEFLETETSVTQPVQLVDEFVETQTQKSMNLGPNHEVIPSARNTNTHANLQTAKADPQWIAPVALGSGEAMFSQDEEGFTDSSNYETGQDISSADGLVSPQTSTASQSFVVASPQANKSQETANVRQVVEQAQMMIRQGGGEMKIKLNPEGLGEVHLKVAVDNGRVQVEMVTQNNEAKKMLERGLGDLKATLASHKLNVDNVQVDMSGDLARHMNQQHQEAERHFAQQFLQEFRDQNQSWRRGFFDISGARPMKSQTDDEADNAHLTTSSVRRRPLADRRLNLVA